MHNKQQRICVHQKIKNKKKGGSAAAAAAAAVAAAFDKKMNFIFKQNCSLNHNSKNNLKQTRFRFRVAFYRLPVMSQQPTYFATILNELAVTMPKATNALDGVQRLPNAKASGSYYHHYVDDLRRLNVTLKTAMDVLKNHKNELDTDAEVVQTFRALMCEFGELLESKKSAPPSERDEECVQNNADGWVNNTDFWLWKASDDLGQFAAEAGTLINSTETAEILMDDGKIRFGMTKTSYLNGHVDYKYFAVDTGNGYAIRNGVLFGTNNPDENVFEWVQQGNTASVQAIRAYQETHQLFQKVRDTFGTTVEALEEARKKQRDDLQWSNLKERLDWNNLALSPAPILL